MDTRLARRVPADPLPMLSVERVGGRVPDRRVGWYLGSGRAVCAFYEHVSVVDAIPCHRIRALTGRGRLGFDGRRTPSRPPSRASASVSAGGAGEEASDTRTGVLCPPEPVDGEVRTARGDPVQRREQRH